MNSERVHLRAALGGIALVVAVALVGGCSYDETSTADLAGIDADRNGVRDDVDKHIAGRDPDYVEFLTAFAANEQRAVTLDVDVPDATAEAFEILDTVNLLVSCPPAGLDPRIARDEADRLVAVVANTPERRENHDRVSSMNSGRSMPAPACNATSAPVPSTTPPPADA